MGKAERLRKFLLVVAVPALVAIGGLIPQTYGPVEFINDLSYRGASASICAGSSPDPLKKAEEVNRCKARSAFLLIVVATLAAGVLGYFEYELPSHNLRRLEAFRLRYLDTTVRPLWEKLRELYGPHIRFNVMIAKRSRLWPFRWPRGLRFDFAYQLGFDFPKVHRDRQLRLWTSQGVAGEAFRTESPVAKMAATLGKTLTPDQAAQTSHVKWILSVPMFRDPGPQSTELPQVVGVINIDVTDEAAALRVGTPENIEDLSDTLLKIGKVAADLW